MKVAVLSDVHGNDKALKRTIEDLKKLCIENIIILGDVVVNGPNPSEVLNLLKNESLNAIAWIKGNTELWLSEKNEDLNKEQIKACNFVKENLSEDDINFLVDLPTTASLNIENKTILCVHGTPNSINSAIDDSIPDEQIKEEIKGVKEDIILCGHSHVPYVGRINGKTIFNVGSVGNPLDGDNRLSYGILDFHDYSVDIIKRRLSYNAEETTVDAE